MSFLCFLIFFILPSVRQKVKRMESPLKIVQNNKYKNARFVCMCAISCEFLIMTLASGYLAQCFEYNVFYVIALAPQMCRFFGALVGIFASVTGNHHFFEFTQRFYLGIIILTLVITIPIQTYFMKYHDHTVRYNQPSEYYGRHIFYWGVVGMFFFDIFKLTTFVVLDTCHMEIQKRKACVQGKKSVDRVNSSKS